MLHRLLLGAILLAPQARAAALTASDLALLNRISWGINESSVAAMQAVGREKWLNDQLHPSAARDVLPGPVQAQINAMSISQHSMIELVARLQVQNKTVNAIKDPAEKQPLAQAYQQAMTLPAREAAARSILRDLYSPAQLREQMTWFWFNHFNVHQYKADIRPMIADYEEHAIRDHALGRFRDLLGATAHHPAMLRYLDNTENAKGHINENYAREIMELHTMGVGSGYSQTDVQELARILTGLGMDPRPPEQKLQLVAQGMMMPSGLVALTPARHDFGDKVFLGATIKGSGEPEIEQALDMLARHPATARHISIQLATYFLGEAPPEALTKQMSDTFLHSDGDIAAVLSVLFHSAVFEHAPERLKDPVHYAISAVRLAYDERVILNTGPIQNWCNRMAEGFFNKDTPDGYPLNATAWNGPGQVSIRFEIARQIGSGGAGLFKPDGPGAVDQPGFPMIQSALFYNRLNAMLSPTTRAALGQAISPQEWNALYLSSPEFMY